MPSTKPLFEILIVILVSSPNVGSLGELRGFSSTEYSGRSDGTDFIAEVGPGAIVQLIELIRITTLSAST